MFKKYREIDLFVVLLWVAFSTELLFRNFHQYSLYVIIPFLFFRSLVLSPKMLKNKYLKAYVIIIIWSLITCYTGINRGKSLNAFRIMGGGFMTSIIMYSFIIRSKSIKGDFTILLTYAFLFVSTFIYLYITDTLVALDITYERLEGENMNGNDIAYYLFAFVITTTLGFIQSKNKLGGGSMIIGVLLIVLTLWCSIVTGSRQIVVVILPMTIVSAIFLFKKRSNEFDTGSNKINKSNAFLLLLGISLTLIVFNVFFKDVLGHSNLMNRMHENVQEDSRVVLLKKAFETGVSHPFFGVGTGCFATYTKGPFSHCTYLELFANSGIIPMFAYIYMVVEFIKDQKRRYKITRDRIFKYLYYIGLFWAVYNFFYAFHTSAWIISFFFLLIGYSEKKYNDLMIN